MAFASGQRLTAALLNNHFTALQTDTQNTSGTTTSTSYTATLTSGTTCSTTFVAPTSGKVLVISTSQLDNSAVNLAAMAFEIRAGAVVGSGTVFITGADAEAAILQNTDTVRFSCVEPVTGLTAGSTYNIRQIFKSTNAANTATFNNKRLTVAPQPA